MTGSWIPGKPGSTPSAYTLTQGDLDGRGNGNGFLDNLATASSNEFGSVSDRERVELIYNNDLLIDKRFVGVTGGNGNLAADRAGDILNYQISVSNGGNISQTNIQVTDQVETYGVTKSHLCQRGYGKPGHFGCW